MSYKSFRLNYPQASLETELVKIDYGLYIVRCVIKENSIILVTALAADRNIEIADNRAIERALNLISISEKTGISKELVRDEKPIESVTIQDVLVSELIAEKDKIILNESSKEDLNDTSNPIDFSEIIAKTNRELRRIAWSSQQGKDHLIKNYNKRSRQLLSDEELLDFLRYLEKIPTSPDRENIF